MPRKAVEIVSAKDWRKRLTRLEKMKADERREFQEKTRLEVSTRDLRDATVGEVYAKYGKGDDGLSICQANGGPAPQTIRNWDKGVTEFPHLQTIRRALLACDMDLRPVSLLAAE